jgi:hypothetical protein
MSNGDEKRKQTQKIHKIQCSQSNQENRLAVKKRERKKTASDIRQDVRTLSTAASPRVWDQSGINRTTLALSTGQRIKDGRIRKTILLIGVRSQKLG